MRASARTIPMRDEPATRSCTTSARFPLSAGRRVMSSRMRLRMPTLIDIQHRYRDRDRVASDELYAGIQQQRRVAERTGRRGGRQGVRTAFLGRHRRTDSRVVGPDDEGLFAARAAGCCRGRITALRCCCRTAACCSGGGGLCGVFFFFVRPTIRTSEYSRRRICSNADGSAAATADAQQRTGRRATRHVHRGESLLLA